MVPDICSDVYERPAIGVMSLDQIKLFCLVENALAMEFHDRIVRVGDKKVNPLPTDCCLHDPFLTPIFRHWQISCSIPHACAVARWQVFCVLQHTLDVHRVDRGDPGFAVRNAVGNQKTFSVRVPSQSGGEFNSLLMKEERSAHPAQRVRLIEPDESVLIVSPFVGRPPLDFVNQGEPSTVKANQLRAAPESFGDDRRRSVAYRPPTIVHHAGRVTQINELQAITLNLWHPVLSRAPLVPPSVAPANRSIGTLRVRVRRCAPALAHTMPPAKSSMNRMSCSGRFSASPASENSTLASFIPFSR